jgi:hypothetical protein
MMDARSVARALGGDVVGRDSISAPGPGHSRKDRSLSIKLDPNARGGFIVNSFAGDDPLTSRDYVCDRLGLPAWQPGDGQDRRVHHSHRKEFDRMAIDRDAEPRSRTEDDQVRIERALAIWNQASDPRGTVAEHYLQSRALELHDDVAGAVLRFHPRCPWHNEDTGNIERIPCLITAFRSIDNDEITAIHRIRVDQPERWPKADRKMRGIVHRAAVKLDPSPIDSTIAIGEGVETCLAARQLGITPTWALGSVGMISFFPILPGIRTLRILGEAGDESRQAIEICGARWRQANRRVRAIWPNVGAKDLNDTLMQRNDYGRTASRAS